MRPVSPKRTPLNPQAQISLSPVSYCSHVFYHRDRKLINTLIKYFSSSHLHNHSFKMTKLKNKLKSIYIHLMISGKIPELRTNVLLWGQLAG